MRHLKVWSVVLAAALSTTAALMAQEGEAARERIYLQEEPDWDEPRWAVGVGLGLVRLGDALVDDQLIPLEDDVETYLTVNLRVAVKDRLGSGNRSGFRGFLEPELGYWDSAFGSDMLLGVNLIGAVPTSAVDFFVGGGIGVHLIDIDDQQIGNVRVAGRSDEALGVNAQFGVDVNFSRALALFAVGRFDLVDDIRDEFEGKATVGLRFRF